ncbi:MAG: HD domain-containing protein [Lachnospiraceae bacterium]|nr:HD domain-containing protein [Lachnospiraceae bacterium]
MFEIIRAHQLNIMLFLCGSCGVLVFLLIATRFLDKRRKFILIHLELIALALIFFDRLAYIYAGDVSRTGFYMVRISNFLVYFLTSGLICIFNLYLADWIGRESSRDSLPKRLKAAGILSALGMVMAVLSAFTGFYYYFDETNRYHRGSGFLIAYIIPVICPIIQFTVVRQYRRIFGKLIYTSLVLYIFVPIACGIIQIFTYGISITNMAMVLVTIGMYLFTYLDINNTVEHAHEIEIQNMQGEKKRMQRLFDQTATAFVSAVEKRDDFSRGKAVKVADISKKIAKLSGKDDDYCEQIYYAALLHDVGMIGIPDSVIENGANPTKQDRELLKQKPVIGKEILSNITEYPYLSQAAYYSNEKYNGTGYPEGLKGDDIPEMARMIAVADAYVTMTTKQRDSDAQPFYIAREEFIKGSGEEYDPDLSKIMVKIIDSDSTGETKEDEKEEVKDFSCSKYRENISSGIAVENCIKRIGFECIPEDPVDGFSEPAIVLFDSSDKRVHSDEKTIEEYLYIEYAEIWFDDHMVITEAKKAEVTGLSHFDKDGDETGGNENTYEITASRDEDHIKLEMKGPECGKEIIIALPDRTRWSYIGLTGEHCRIKNVTIERVEGTVDIPRIAKGISYIDHMESDIPNVQVDGTRTASTEGIVLKDRLKIIFHTMSLPSANLVWHCPYIVLYYSDDGSVYGDGYREYSLIKINGEIDDSNEFADNSAKVKRKDEFPGWDTWKESNREGMECEISVIKKDNRIVIKTENLGINIESTTVVKDGKDTIYAAITGDQVALTDIRIG